MFSDHYRYHQNQKHHSYIAEDDDVTYNFTSSVNKYDVIKIKDKVDVSKVMSDSKVILDPTLYRPFLCLAVKDGYNEIVHSKYNLTILFTTNFNSSENKGNDDNEVNDINTDEYKNIQNNNIISVSYNNISHQIDLSFIYGIQKGFYQITDFHHNHHHSLSSSLSSVQKMININLNRIFWFHKISKKQTYNHCYITNNNDNITTISTTMIKYKLCSFLLYLKIQTIHLTIEWIKIGFIIIINMNNNNNDDDDDSSHNKIKHKTPNSFYRG
jgi:hypothetical protein